MEGAGDNFSKDPNQMMCEENITCEAYGGS